jgi:hypothetical protein
MRRLFVLVVLVLTALVLPAPAHAVLSVTSVTIAAGTPKTVSSKLDLGSTVDLAWAARSSVACFPATKNDHFNGNHVLFAVDLPKSSVLTVTATPGSASQDISLYGYTVSASDTTTLPPNVNSVVSCEASYGTTSLSAPYNPGKEETIKLVATTAAYRVVIGVAGAQGQKTGNFSLKLSLETAAAAPTGKITSATNVALTANGTKTVLGRIDGGTKIDLAWAANSAVACFPATQNASYDGNHVVYAVDLPSYSELVVTVKPMNASVDLSLYGYTVSSTDTTSLPPSVSSVVSCEASSGNSPNPGASETIKLIATKNPYRAYFGVAGAGGATTGGFQLSFSHRATN